MDTTSNKQATPESVWAILQENARQLTRFAAEADARMKAYEAQREKDVAEATQWKKEYEERQKKWTSGLTIWARISADSTTA
jgi:hypothetical protein